MSKSTSKKSQEVAEDNGVVNPSGLAVALFGPVYLAMVPVTSYITQPSGLVQELLDSGLGLLPLLGTADQHYSHGNPSALRAVHLRDFWRVWRRFSRRPGNVPPRAFDNNHPRKHVHSMSGLPLRMRSAHLNLMENFPGFAVAAALAQSLAPGNQHMVNLLALHVFLKVGLYYVSYLANIPRRGR